MDVLALAGRMIYPFVFSSLATVIIGFALLLHWRKFPDAKFTRDLGLGYLIQAAVPLFYFAYTQASDAGQALALAGTFACGVAYWTFLILGIARLANRQFSGPMVAVLVPVLSLVLGYPLYQHDWPLVSAMSGLITFGVGLVAWSWLWPSPRSERWVGPLLCFMGVVHFTPVAFGIDAAAAQVTANTLLRLVLGLVLLHTGLQLSIVDARRLRLQSERLTENSHQGVAVAYAAQVVYCNPAFLRIYGVTSLQEASAEWISSCIPADELASIMKMRHQVLDGTLAEARWEGLRRRKDGTPLHLHFVIWRTEWNGLPALQTVITDDTEHHDRMATLLHQATHDELTGLPNRAALLQRLRERCHAPAPGADFGLVVLDIDRFKLFNDAHGHAVSDEVVKAMAGMLQRGLAEVAEVSRLGADGFALLTRAGVAPSETHELAQRVRQMLAWPLVLTAQEFFIDVSMGIALFPQTGTDAESLLRAANAAMREAKKTPGTSVLVADPRFERGSGEMLEQEQALRAGIINREFSLAYQPKVDAASGALLGFEALARWQRPGVGYVSPSQFIAVAERTGLIGSLGMLLLSQACEQVARWREQATRLVPVAVNVSPLQMLDPRFPQLVSSTLQRHGIPADLITLEVTESAATANMEQTRAQLIQLRDLGVKAALDDFGTGFSSLDMLRSLPLNVVKIDRSLIDPMPAPDAIAVVQAICQLAAVLKLRVVAEGVETEAQA
ncbi:bifunctional diguanylate cyclase/phosphodiesterase, partial [Rhodoferax sp.]|uniref:putative bifunctional diguanylate cyclase/phosphodiesterase n=1 Tax=Rhodoferax sp. TaxID=50421 RepID=UPI002721C26B